MWAEVQLGVWLRTTTTKKCLLVIDNCHCSEIVASSFAAQGIAVKFFPPYMSGLQWISERKSKLNLFQQWKSSFESEPIDMMVDEEYDIMEELDHGSVAGYQ